LAYLNSGLKIHSEEFERFLIKLTEDRSFSSFLTILELARLRLTTSLLLKPLVLLSKNSLIILTLAPLPSILPRVSI
jgi:hypothetical protein